MLSLKDMKIGVRYRVVECAKRGSFKIGDRVSKELGLDDAKPLVALYTGSGGFLLHEEWIRIRKARVELDLVYYKKRMMDCMSIIDGYERIVAKNGGR